METTEPREVWQQLLPAETEPPYNPDLIKQGAKVTVTMGAVHVDVPPDFFRVDGREARMQSLVGMIGRAVQRFAEKHGG